MFGVPLVSLATHPGNVPKAMRMCMEEVEKRGLDTHNIYSMGSIYDPEIRQLRRRFESERNFSFSSTDNIRSVAMLLRLYLRDLPEPLFMLTLEDYRSYGQNRARYTENDCSVLRPKIRELHPTHRASLEALLRHLLLVSSHSDKNAMTVEVLAGRFCYTVLRGNVVSEGGAHAKKLVMEDLIQNAHVLFGERPPPSPPFPSHMPGDVSISPTSDGDWWLPQPGLHQRSESPTIPQCPSESVTSSTSDLSFSSTSFLSSPTRYPSPAARANRAPYFHLE